MLKITSVAGPAKNPKQGGQGIQIEDQDEKEPAQKSRKGQKRQNPKSGSMLKKQKPPELRTLAANQDCSLPLTLGGPLPN